MNDFREATNIGNKASSVLNLFFSAGKRENEFTDYCKQILVEAEKESRDYYNGGNLNFFNILMNNRQNLTMNEIQDEVSTMILTVSFFFCLNIRKF